MPEGTVLQVAPEAADTIAHYVKENVTVKGFFWRTRKNRRVGTFSIHVAYQDMSS